MSRLFYLSEIIQHPLHFSKDFPHPTRGKVICDNCDKDCTDSYLTSKECPCDLCVPCFKVLSAREQRPFKRPCVSNNNSDDDDDNNNQVISPPKNVTHVQHAGGAQQGVKLSSAKSKPVFPFVTSKPAFSFGTPNPAKQMVFPSGASTTLEIFGSGKGKPQTPSPTPSPPSELDYAPGER